MQMARDSRAGSTAEIHAEIHAIGFVERFEGCLGALRQVHHFRERCRVHAGNFRGVFVGNDHQMARSIGKAIQNSERACATMHDERRRVVHALRRIAKNARGLFTGNGIGDVLVAPGSPDVIHCGCASQEFERASIAQNKTPAIAGVALPSLLKQSQPRCELPPAAASAAAVIDAASSLFTKSFNSLLGLKKGIFFAGTSTFSPVLGLRPVRPRRWRVRKLPNPRISILSPFCSDSMMLSKIVSTMDSDSLRGNSVTRNTSSIKSAFVSVGCLL